MDLKVRISYHDFPSCIFFLISFTDILNVLAGAIEFKESADIRSGEEKELNAINTAIATELDTRFSEKFDRLNEVREDKVKVKMIWGYSSIWCGLDCSSLSP